MGGEGGVMKHSGDSHRRRSQRCDGIRHPSRHILSCVLTGSDCIASLGPGVNCQHLLLSQSSATCINENIALSYRLS